MTTIESLERQLSDIQNMCGTIDWVKTDLYFKGKVKMKRAPLVVIENRCREVLDACADYTVENGHSDRADSVKENVFTILGKVTGEDI